MNKYFFFFLICVSSYAQKRGLAYGFHSSNDIEILTPQTSWWYNWSETPDDAIATNFSEANYEFVPMTWNGNFNETVLRTFLENHPETKYLLAFNEPNFLEQANMTPSEVVAIWPTLEAIASDYNLEIVGPAVNFCGDCVIENGTTYTDPFDYLDDFFELCQDCKVDHIAVHVYMNTIEATSWFINEFKKYDRPIWVTEFAGWESNGVINSIGDQINYMMSAVDYFESEEAVFRYAWFIGRSGNGITNYPYLDILEDDGELTELGEAYLKMPVHSEDTVVAIPAVIEAENYNTMDAVFLQKTSDNNGFADVSYLDAEDWLTYKILASDGGNYNINYRLASSKETSLSLYVDDILVSTQEITNTGGFENHQTFSNTISLTEGEHSIKIVANSDGFRLNWFEFQLKDALSIESNEEIQFTVSPNPFNESIRIISKNNLNSLIIYSIEGAKVAETIFSNDEKIDLSSLSIGIYILKLTDLQGNTSFKKIIKK